MADKPTPKKDRTRKSALSAELVAATLAELHGNIAATAKRFNVARSTMSEFIAKRATLQKVIQDAKEGMTDNAESSLYRAVLAGEAWAVCFYLKTQAKSRGYVERSELTGKNGGPIQGEQASEVKHEHTLSPAAFASFLADVRTTGLGDVSTNGHA